MPIPIGVLAVAGAGGGAGGAGAYELLETTILGSDTSTVTFSNVNTNYGSTYEHLQVRWTARSTRTGNSSIMRLRINGATTGYKAHQLIGNGSSVTSGVPGATDYIAIEYIHAASMTANVYSGGVIDLLDAFSTNKNKTIRSLWMGEVNNAIITAVYLQSGLLENTAATSTIEFSDNFNNLRAGTRFSLYGLRST